jgi:hypothetical protein
VFHPMRVLEVGLRVLARQFNIDSGHRNWKDDREFYSQCASYFRVVKDAWRNYTAHARGNYIDEESFDMMANVRGFMQRLAVKLREEPASSF